MQKILSFIMAIVAFFMQLLGFGGKKNYVEFPDLACGNDPNQVVDLVLPKSAGSTGLFVFIHGGSWIGGDEDDGKSAVTYCAQNLKLAAVSLNYRFLNENGTVHCREMLDDITSGIQAAVNKAREQGLEVSCVAIGGVSAGAHLALLYSYMRYNECPVPIKFVFSEAGPTDFSDKAFADSCTGIDKTLLYRLLSELSGTTVTPENYETAVVQNTLRAISPVSYVNKNSVPTVMAYGEKDTVVTFKNATALHTALLNANVRNDFFRFPNSGHELDADRDVRKAYEDKLLEYIRTYLF